MNIGGMCLVVTAAWWPRGTPSGRRFGRGCQRVRPRRRGSAVLGEELHDVVQSKPAIATLADAIERKLAAIAEPLHRVHVQVQHVGDFGRGEHRSQFVYGHRCHVVFCLTLHVDFTGQGPCGAQG